jgi:SAM-dependent methyltransferase
LLVPTGARVVAVEPLAEMRAQLEAVLPDVEVLAATAEELPLPDASADAITVAAAIHWFDLPRALAELHRVMKPGGALGIVGPGRDLSQALQQAVDEIIGEHLPDPSGFGFWREEIRASGLFSLDQAIEVPYEQLLDAKGLEERIATISYVARLPDDVRAPLLERVRALGEAQAESPFPFRYRIGATVLRRLGQASGLSR